MKKSSIYENATVITIGAPSTICREFENSDGLVNFEAGLMNIGNSFGLGNSELLNRHYVFDIDPVPLVANRSLLKDGAFEDILELT